MVIFFFFLEDIDNEPIIKKAFQTVCGNKLNADGYCNMDEFIYSPVDRFKILCRLIEENSPFTELYKKDPPNQENLMEIWTLFKESLPISTQNIYLDASKDQRDEYVAPDLTVGPQRFYT